jgi:hypothetical protein
MKMREEEGSQRDEEGYLCCSNSKSREIQSLFTEIVFSQLAFDFEESTKRVDLPHINSD